MNSESKLDDFLEMRIKDTGIGIAPHLLDKVFDKFYQIDSTSTRKAGGSGLGLAITKSFIEEQGGTIRIESTPHVGTTFIFRLSK